MDSVSVSDIDGQLAPLLNPIAKILQGRDKAIVFLSWEIMDLLSLLPFHLHLRWPDAIPTLSLATCVGVAPFHRGEVLVDDLRIYAVQECHHARKTARVRRHEENRLLRNDLISADWELVAARHPRLRSLKLPAEAFIGIDSVVDDGEIRPGRRPVFGRRIPKGTFRPRVLVTGRSGVLRNSLPAFEGLELLILDAQALRGRMAAEAVRGLLSIRSLPTVIVASCIGDLLALQVDQIAEIKSYELNADYAI